MEKARKVFHYAESKVKYHKEHFRVLDNVSRRYIYLAERYDALNDIAKIMGDRKASELTQQELLTIKSKLILLRDTSIQLNSEYAELWLQRNKYPMLDNNLNRIQRQIAEFQQILTLLESGDLVASSKPVGTWFWYPEGDPLVKTEIGKAYFERVVELSDNATFVEIKCWADDTATVYINGRKMVTAIMTANRSPAMPDMLLKKGKIIFVSKQKIPMVPRESC